MVSLNELGRLVASARRHRNLRQEDLAEAANTNRSAVAHLEQARRVPPPDILEAICRTLDIPIEYWRPLTEQNQQLLQAFEYVLSEFVGEQTSSFGLDDSGRRAVAQVVEDLFTKDLTKDQSLDNLNSALVFYGRSSVSQEFFDQYLGPDAFKSIESFEDAVRGYQKDAIRLFSTFSEAFRVLNGATSLKVMLQPLSPRSDANYRGRTEWRVIQKIDDSRLADLGYIASDTISRERIERDAISSFLRTLALSIRERGAQVVGEITEKTRRRMDSLLRKFESRIDHGTLSPLFAPDPDLLEREADHLSPKLGEDITRLRETEKIAEQNLAHYLAADHLDVYIATSMRTEPDFISVNNFANRLFQHNEIRPLRLRHFNPTHSWIRDRIAKGLVEALMLKRADFTIYMAQKSDTFGKDSEASVALGQGKPVIVYVPKLVIPKCDVDSETIGRLGKVELQRILATEGDEADKEVDEAMDEEALLGRLIGIRVERGDALDLAQIARDHWADFDLYGESGRLKDSADKMSGYRKWLDQVVREGVDCPPPEEITDDFRRILVAAALNFERRARLFREIHPLALQVILNTGVLNGILVVRSVDSCATLLRRLIRNDLDLELEIDESNYKLIETTTRSTIRVISRHRLLTNAFLTHFQ